MNLEPEPSRRAPDFLIVGAAKSGTTSLFHYLAQHPGLFLPIIDKEPGYYCDIWGTDDADYYFKLFANARPNQLTAEATTVYLTCPASAGLIHAANPKAKIIMVLRNPAERAFSLYLQMVKMGHEQLAPFERALDAEPARAARDPHAKFIPGYHYNYLYFASGLYEDQVQRYFDLFPAKQIHVLLFDELIGGIEAQVAKVLEFLEVPGGLEFESEVFNPAGYPRFVRLQHFLKYAIEDRSRRLKVDRGIRLASWLKNWNLARGKVPKLSPETYNGLVDRYAKSITATGQLIGRDLSHWQQKR